MPEFSFQCGPAVNHTQIIRGIKNEIFTAHLLPDATDEPWIMKHHKYTAVNAQGLDSAVEGYVNAQDFYGLRLATPIIEEEPEEDSDDEEERLMAEIELSNEGVKREKEDVVYVTIKPAASPRKCTTSFVLTSVVFLLTVVAPLLVALSHQPTKKRDDQNAGPVFECPAFYEETSDEAKLYTDRDKNITDNIHAYLQSFRSSTYDEWRKTYNEYKSDMTSYKASKFGELRSGDSIYESASGLGLNLVMTLEILHEVHNITNLVVYGNDFVKESVVLSNKLMDRGILPADGQKGRICQGDSTDLSNVPSNSFDLVYTGYITPLWDPLQKNASTDTEMWAFYGKICRGRQDHPKFAMLHQQMQLAQQDWYAQWVEEMVRIAKPGAPVIVESVSQPYCDNPNDWDGVDRRFWRQAVRRGRWDVDVASLDIETNQADQTRDNVFLRKKTVVW